MDVVNPIRLHGTASWLRGALVIRVRTTVIRVRTVHIRVYLARALFGFESTLTWYLKWRVTGV